MRIVRLTLSAAVLAAVCAPAAASANQCNPYFREEKVGPVTLTTVDIVC